VEALVGTVWRTGFERGCEQNEESTIVPARGVCFEYVVIFFFLIISSSEPSVNDERSQIKNCLLKHDISGKIGNEQSDGKMRKKK
jgi:hypothetical protein